MPEKRGKLTWLDIDGGPLLLLSEALLPFWEGSDPPSGGRTAEATFRWGDPDAVATDYDRACDVDDYLGLVDVDGGKGLVLGDEPMSTAWFPRGDDEHEGMLVRWVYADNESSVLSALSQVPDDIWEPTRLTFPVASEPLHLFGAAYPGTEAREKSMLRLAPGDYSIATAQYKPDDRTFLVLHRFTATAQNRTD